MQELMLMPGWRIARVRNHGRIVLDQDGIVNDSKASIGVSYRPVEGPSWFRTQIR